MSPSHLHAATGLLVIQQQLHGSHHLLTDGVQQGIADVDVEAQQEFNDFQVLVLDCNQQSCAAQRVDAVDVDLEVDLRLLEKDVIASQELLLYFVFKNIFDLKRDCTLTREIIEIIASRLNIWRRGATEQLVSNNILCLINKHLGKR